MNYYEVGYIIISNENKYVSQSYNLDNLSPTILSISNYIKPTYPDEWLFSWVHNSNHDITRETIINDLNVSNETLEQAENFIEDLESKNRFVWPNVFYCLENAKQFKNKFLFNIKKLRIVKICIPEDFYEDFIINEKDEIDMPSIYQFVKGKKIEELSFQDKKLGFDICGFSNGGFYSFICNGLQNDFLDNQVRLNPYSLIEQYKDALDVISLIDKNIIQAEEILWYPWLLIDCI
jgi:hypothetical protein